MEVDETQPCGSLPASPWSCSPDGHIPCGSKSPGFGMSCMSEDQLEANGGLVIFFPDSQESGQPFPAAYDTSRTEADTVSMLRLAFAQAFQRSSCPVGYPPLAGHAETSLDHPAAKSMPLYVGSWPLLACQCTSAAPADSFLQFTVIPCNRNLCHTIKEPKNLQCTVIHFAWFYFRFYSAR